MADRTEILETIKEHLKQRGIEADNVDFDSDFSNDLGVDSLDLVEMTLGLEERYGIEIPDDEIENVSKVGDAVDLIQRKLSVGA